MTDTLKESKFADILRGLGFFKTEGTNNPKIVEMLGRLQCCMYFAFTNPSKTYVTDEMGQDWEADAEVDLMKHEGFKPPWAFNDEPEIKEVTPSKLRH